MTNWQCTPGIRQRGNRVYQGCLCNWSRRRHADLNPSDEMGDRSETYRWCGFLNLKMRLRPLGALPLAELSRQAQKLLSISLSPLLAPSKEGLLNNKEKSQRKSNLSQRNITLNWFSEQNGWIWKRVPLRLQGEYCTTVKLCAWWKATPSRLGRFLTGSVQAAKCSIDGARLLFS